MICKLNFIVFHAKLFNCQRAYLISFLDRPSEVYQLFDLAGCEKNGTVSRSLLGPILHDQFCQNHGRVNAKITNK